MVKHPGDLAVAIGHIIERRRGDHALDHSQALHKFTESHSIEPVTRAMITAVFGQQIDRSVEVEPVILSVGSLFRNQERIDDRQLRVEFGYIFRTQECVVGIAHADQIRQPAASERGHGHAAGTEHRRQDAVIFVLSRGQLTDMRRYVDAATACVDRLHQNVMPLL